jgi:hypothetical protein
MLKKLLTPRFILTFGLLALLIAPALLILPAILPAFNFAATGQIGDTIGGITSPIVNMTGALLVYFAFREQVRANEILQTQITEQKTNRKEDNESETLFEIYGYLVDAIDNFSFTGFHEHELVNASHYHKAVKAGEHWKGSGAIFILLDQIRCHYHGTAEDLDKKQEVAELNGLLRIMELLTERLQNSSNENRSILTTLIEHQFKYRIMTRLKDCETADLKKRYCEECRHEHGIPDGLLALIQKIEENLGRIQKGQHPTKLTTT